MDTTYGKAVAFAVPVFLALIVLEIVVDVRRTHYYRLADAINSLAGEGRDRTYDAFSILFLMAKAGEVQPLLQTISKHANVQVRLTATKVLALSNQQQVLPALRSLALAGAQGRLA